ncbi:unnamed protein product [Amoebophrya sp. A25]|nr:unnamed protein product [Amoebophrya sp. A25]|eukprot:GSA25T00013055001.1
MQLFARSGNPRTQRLLALAKISDVEVDVIADTSSNKDAFGKIPVLEVKKGSCIFSSNAIGRYLARMRPDIGLYGQNFIEGGEVDSWVEYSTHELENPICAWTFPMEQIFPEVTHATTRAKMDVAACLKTLDMHLTLRTFMVGEKLTFADVHIASVLWSPIEKHKCLTEMMEPLVHLTRWYKLITAQPGWKAAFGASSTMGAKGGAGGKPATAKAEAKPKAKAEAKAKAEPKAKGAKAKAPAAPAAAPEKPAGPSPADIKKKVIKEGGKRGVEIEGVSDMGGLNFFCTAVDAPKGDLEYTEMSVDAMNAKADPAEEERRGGSGHVGKMIFSSDVDCACVCYVPEKLQDKTTADVWMLAMLKAMGEEASYVKEKSTKTKAFALLKGNPDKFRFGIKMKDDALTQANAYLRSNGLFPDDDSDDEEMVFGDDDFPS